MGSQESVSADCQNCAGDDTINALWARLRNGTLDKFGPAECMAEYDTQIQARRENVILVTTTDSSRNAFINASPSYFNGSKALYQIHDTNIHRFDTFNASKGFSREANVSYSWAYTGASDLVNRTESSLSDDIRQTPHTWSAGQNVTYYNTTKFFGWLQHYSTTLATMIPTIT